jgi:hypothetical protein
MTDKNQGSGRQLAIAHRAPNPEVRNARPTCRKACGVRVLPVTFETRSAVLNQGFETLCFKPSVKIRVSTLSNP